MKISNNLSRLRKERGIYQKQLATDTSYDCRTIRRVEHGECAPSAEFMFHMSEYFGVPIEDILGLVKTADD